MSPGKVMMLLGARSTCSTEAWYDQPIDLAMRYALQAFPARGRAVLISLKATFLRRVRHLKKTDHTPRSIER